MAMVRGEVGASSLAWNFSGEIPKTHNATIASSAFNGTSALKYSRSENKIGGSVCESKRHTNVISTTCRQRMTSKSGRRHPTERKRSAFRAQIFSPDDRHCDAVGATWTPRYLPRA